jgi:AraC-like DNA-binding protein
LVNHALPMTEPLAENHAAPALVEKTSETPRREAPAPQVADLPIAQNISNLAEEGFSAAEIAQHLGISLSEVTLALKMNAGRNFLVGRKVMAVA